MTKWILTMLYCFVAVLSWAPRAWADDDIVFIVNSSNPVSTISLIDLSAYFFKKKRQWPDGTSVRFIDRSVKSPERKTFLNSFLQKSSNDVEEFWIGQKLYTGDSAPLQGTSESMAIQFVSAFKGAIGYVSSSTSLRSISSAKVKVIKVAQSTE